MNEPTNPSIKKFLKEFQATNEKIAPLDLCLCVLDGAHTGFFPYSRQVSSWTVRTRVEATWFCKTTSATRLIGQLFSSQDNQQTTTKEKHEKD